MIFGVGLPRVHVDGIALDGRGEWLYLHAVSGRTLYRVRTVDLRDRSLTAQQLGARVERLADTGPVDGMLLEPSEGALYLTALEQDAIVAWRPAPAAPSIITQDPRIQWPDSLALRRLPGGGALLYFTVSLLHLDWPFNWGLSARHGTPYRLFAVRLAPGASGRRVRR